MDDIQLILDPRTQLVTVDDPSPTISVQWDQAVQQAVIVTSPGPTIASRAYGILHTAMFDAWSAYDPDAAGTQLGDELQRPVAENTDANKTEAMSFAAYRVLSELFPTQQATFDTLMAELGFDPANTTEDTTTAAGIGNVVATALLEFRSQDGSNQANGFADTTGYQPVNPNPNTINDIEAWTPEFVPVDSGSNLQTFLTPQWSIVEPFAIDSPSALRPVAPEPFLLVEGASVDLETGTITLADGSVETISLDIVGTDPAAGAIINEAFIDQAEDLIEVSAELTDEQKLVAEFWEDGGGTSFPPGTWMTFGEFVSARDDNTLDEDALLFFALGNAVFDAGVATWEAKVFYDYARPIRAIRDLGRLGLLNDGTIGADEITGETGFVIDAWAGPGEGTKTILAENFITYQLPGGNVSPPFAEYTSGHSAFSAAGAEILQLFTGSDEFGASVTFEQGESLFEPGFTPTAANSPLTLEWGTFSEASDEAGISRIYGGIHFDDGDQNGRALGREVGSTVWQEAQVFATGGPNERVVGTPDNDELVAGDPNLNFDGNDDTVLGLAGNDTIDGALAGLGANVLGGGANADSLFGNLGDRLYGDTGNDELFANATGAGDSNNLLQGGVGNDTLFPNQNDFVSGGAGNDIIFAGDGGNNTLRGGSGNDVFFLANGATPNNPNIITDFNAAEDTLQIDLAGVDSFADLTFIQSGDNVVVSLTNGGTTLATLQNTQVTDFVDGTNVFVNDTTARNTGSSAADPSFTEAVGIDFIGEVLLPDRNATEDADASGGLDFEGTTVAGLSGITYDPFLNEYHAISDDRSTVRFYTLNIDLTDGSLDEGDIVLTNVTALLDENGVPLVENDTDTEGIAFSDNGSVFIASERDLTGNPEIFEFSLSGQQLESLPVPDQFIPTDANTGVRTNLGFENLTLTPNEETLYTANEEALAQDGEESTAAAGTFVRIIQYDLSDSDPAIAGQFLYQTDPIPAVTNSGQFDGTGLVELLAIDNNGTLLALERTFTDELGNGGKIYQIRLTNETDISDQDSVAGTTIDPADKTLLFDLADLGITIDNVEGMTLGPVLPDGRQSLIIVSDDNFDAFGPQNNQFLAFALDLATGQPPVAIDPATITLEENQPAATVILESIEVTDADDDLATLTYDITRGNLDVDGDGNLAFGIDPSTGQISLNDVDDLNFELNSTFNLEVTVTDPGGLTDIADVAINLTDVNDSPVVSDPAPIEIQELTDDGTVVLDSITVTDEDSSNFTFSLTSGNLDVDGDGNLAFAIDPNTGQITVNDEDDLDFEDSPTFNLGVTVTDPGGLTDTTNVTINLTEVNGLIDLNDSDEDDGIVALLGSTTLVFTLTVNATSFVNELVVFKVEDSDGTVLDSNGDAINPNDADFNQADYLQAILDSSATEVVLSALDASDNRPDAFQGESGLEVELDFDDDLQLGFLLVADGTLDDLEANPGGETFFISTLAGAQLDILNTENFVLRFGDDESGIFDDLEFNVSVSEQDDLFNEAAEFLNVGRVITILDTSVEVIDLRDNVDFLFDFDGNGVAEDITGQPIAVQVTLYREAAFDNLIGFYAVEASDGSVNGIAPSDRQAYAEAAYSSRVGEANAPDNESTSTVTFTFTGGQLLLPFLISNDSSPNADFSNIYFPFLAANADGADHIRLLGRGIFGIEDLPNGGDQDFDDIIIQINSVGLA